MFGVSFSFGGEYCDSIIKGEMLVSDFSESLVFGCVLSLT